MRHANLIYPKSSFLQDLFIQTTIQYLRKKAPQLIQKPSKDYLNYKPIVNIETINILLTVLQLALPSITNTDLIQEIQTMISNAKILNNLTHPFPPSSTNGLSSQLHSLQIDSISFFFHCRFFTCAFIVEDRKERD